MKPVVIHDAKARREAFNMEVTSSSGNRPLEAQALEKFKGVFGKTSARALCTPWRAAARLAILE